MSPDRLSIDGPESRFMRSYHTEIGTGLNTVTLSPEEVALLRKKATNYETDVVFGSLQAFTLIPMEVDKGGAVIKVSKGLFPFFEHTLQTFLTD